MIYRREWLTPKEVIDDLREKMKLPLDWDEKSEAHEIKNEFCEKNFTKFLLHIPNIKPTHPLYYNMKNNSSYLVLKEDKNKFVLLDSQGTEQSWMRDDGVVHVTSGNSVEEVIQKFKRVGSNIKGIAIYDKNESFKFKLVDLDGIDLICLKME